MEANNFNYYDNNEQQKKGKSGVATVFAVVMVILIIAILFVSVILGDKSGSGNDHWIWGTPAPGQTALPGSTDGQNTPAQTNAPVQTSVPIDRTDIPEDIFDGIAPVIHDAANPIPDIVETVSPGVCSITNYVSGYALGQIFTDSIQGTGTGFVISSHGYILTNAHVVDGASIIKVTLSNQEEYTAVLMGMDSTLDVAVLKIDAQNLVPLKLGDSSKLRVGEFAVAIGDPTGSSLAGTPTFGIISSTSRSVNIDGRSNTYIQTDAAINPGNSGGPLLNMKGEVIGMTTAKTVTASYDEYGNAISAEGLGFALPINDILPTVEALIRQGHVERPGVGISVLTITEEYSKAYSRPQGILVYSVIENGPGHLAGLRADDIIVECDGQRLLTQDEFVAAIQSKNVGDTLHLKYWREGSYYECDLIIGDLNSIGDTVLNNEYGGGFLNEQQP